MNPRDRRTPKRTGITRMSFAFLAAIPALALGGEDFGRPQASASVGRSSRMSWWSIPASARDAATNLAKSRDSSVSRCVAIQNDDMITYEIHASHRTGLFRKTDFVLTSVSEPKSVYDKRREEQTLRRRLARLRAAVRPKPRPTDQPSVPGSLEWKSAAPNP